MRQNNALEASSELQAYKPTYSDLQIANNGLFLKKGQKAKSKLSDSESRQALPKVVNHPPTFLNEVQLQQLADLFEETSLLLRFLHAIFFVFFLFLGFYIICTFECDLNSLIKDIFTLVSK